MWREADGRDDYNSSPCTSYRWAKNGIKLIDNWDVSSEFVSSSIPSWQILTAHAQPFRGARDLAFCLKVPLDSLLVWASSGGSGETARMRRLAWTFAARIGNKYQIRLTWPNCLLDIIFFWQNWWKSMCWRSLFSSSLILLTTSQFTKPLLFFLLIYFFAISTSDKTFSPAKSFT